MSEPTNALLIRADAGPEIGAGHAMRCLALAQAWQDIGGTATFALGGSLPGLEGRLRSERIAVERIAVQSGGPEDADQAIRLARRLNSTWMVVDGYRFTEDYLRRIRTAGLCVLLIDDCGQAGHYSAELVLNQNIHAHVSLYEDREPQTRLLLGTRYAMLRREFAAWRTWCRETRSDVRQLLVALGGSDQRDAALKVIRAIQEIASEGTEAVIATGGSDEYVQVLHSAATGGHARIRVARNVENIPELMARSDVAVCAAGSTCWEAAFMGLPSLLGTLADYQKPMADGLHQAGAAVMLGSLAALSPGEIADALARLIAEPATRDAMGRRGRELVDGRGANRVAAQIQLEKLTLRPVDPNDRRMIWQWSNEPEARAASFHAGFITWEQHIRWFGSQLEDPNVHFCVAEWPIGFPVGQIRCHVTGNEATVSVALAPQWRDLGYGTRFIDMMSQHTFESTNVCLIHAYVKPGNHASIRAFTKAGYSQHGVTRIEGQDSLDLVRRRPPDSSPIAGIELSDKAGLGEEAPHHRDDSRSEQGPRSESVIVSIMQPTYLPWLGYFDLIDQSDVFVFLDVAQLVKQSWHQRNRIKVGHELRWLTVPVKKSGRRDQSIEETEITCALDFPRCHIGLIQNSYGRAPYFRQYFPALKSILESAGPSLSTLDQRLIRWMTEVLGLSTEFKNSSALAAQGKRSERLVEICEEVGATTLLAPIGSAVYMLTEPEVFARHGITVRFQNYEHPEYRQMSQPFLPYASTIDLLFNEGERALDIIRSGRRSNHTMDEARNIPQPAQPGGGA